VAATNGAKTAVTCDNNPWAAADRLRRARFEIDRKEARPTMYRGHECASEIKTSRISWAAGTDYIVIYTSAAVTDCLRWYLGRYFRTHEIIVTSTAMFKVIGHASVKPQNRNQ